MRIKISPTGGGAIRVSGWGERPPNNNKIDSFELYYCISQQCFQGFEYYQNLNTFEYNLKIK